MIRQLTVVLAAVLVASTGLTQANDRFRPFPSVKAQVFHLAQAQLSSYPVLKAKLKASLDAIDEKLAEPDNARLKRDLETALARIDQLKTNYFNNRNPKHLTGLVDQYKKVKFKLKPLTDSLAPLMDAPLDVLDTIGEYEGPNLVVDWAEIDSMTANYKKMVNQFADADSMVQNISENSKNYVDDKLSQGEPISMSLYDEADQKAWEMYLNGK